jgi:nitrite reductase/ring-hydroxylating ferredoxin subunit
MDRAKRLICTSSELVDGKQGVRFSVERYGKMEPAFAVRYDGQVYGYINRCAHVPVELDWAEGEFFDLTGLYLMCSTHGATYLPDSGRCIRGPCSGGRLIPLPMVELEGNIYFIEEQGA